MTFAIYAMVYLGSALMVYNIIGFILFARKTAAMGEKKKNGVLYFPIALLIMFLLGYLAVGIFGKPDLIVSGILFGGAIFVFIMYILLGKITKRIAENEQLGAKLMASEESNRAKAEFLSGMSHEMRTPMNVIIGLDTMALMDPSLAPDTKDKLEKIGASAKHLLGLINNILDMNSIDSGEFSVKNVEFSLCDAVGQINAIVGTMCSDRGLEYTVNSEEGVCGRYAGDEMRLKQILLSLLDNAVKYTEAPGKVGLDVARRAGIDGDAQLVFTVSDTGVGIDEKFLPTIFDAFTKEDASSTAIRGGSGIGLAVTKKIVDLLGGTIEVESKKGEGSKFTVALPFEKIADGVSGENEEEASLEGRRILVAEDVPENAEIVMDLLDLVGALCEHAANGQIAVDMFKKSAPGYFDAILMDLRMPVMDGLEATREIRALSRPDAGIVPIIALTANAFESDVKRSVEAGMNVHLAKPADADMLYSTLKKTIKNARA